ncbi:MAG TPA: DUF4271 domain-containing protein [Chitinophagaceae bacterium]|nr:DUF4271 domain-containing protein [Chitinophagaceae bacterium]
MNQQAYKDIIHKNPFFNFTAKPVVQVPLKRQDAGKEGPFYLLMGILLFLALIKVVFGKYMHNLFAVFFRVSLKQKQMREQLLQAPLPSLLLNILFFITGGLYATFLLQHYHLLPDVGFWWLLIYCVAALTILYLAKLLMLKLTGWIFNMRLATDTYSFIVFLVNKLLGICLLPLLLFMAFSQPAVVSVVITLSWCLVAGLFAYRYITSFGAMRKEIKVSRFHFFLYLCAFEIIPLLLIYKVLLEFVERRH